MMTGGTTGSKHPNRCDTRILYQTGEKILDFYYRKAQT
jgi:hypothetical protein